MTREPDQVILRYAEGSGDERRSVIIERLSDGG
jgi:hypothetical protein